MAVPLVACFASATHAIGDTSAPDASAIRAIAVGHDPSFLLVGTDHGLYRSQSGGRPKRLDGLAGRRVNVLVSDYRGGFWASSGDQILRLSSNGTASRHTRARGLAKGPIVSLSASRDVRQRLYALVSGAGLYRSDDGGQRFRLLNASVGKDAAAIAVSLDGMLWLGHRHRGLLVNADGDAGSWTAVRSDTPAAIAVSANHRARLGIATSAGILVSSNAGRSWIRALRAPARLVAWAPRSATIAYAVGADGQVYLTRDAGRHWRRTN